MVEQEGKESNYTEIKQSDFLYYFALLQGTKIQSF